MELLALMHAGLDNGVKKVKFLGGEPLLRRDLPTIVSSLRARDSELDISIITSGVVGIDRLEACFDAGLSRCNVSIHGWTMEAFSLRGGTRMMHHNRTRILESLLSQGRPLKVNYVYTGPEVEDDLARLLDWAADKRLVVNVLDDLSNPDLGFEVLLEMLTRLRGEPQSSATDRDPHSLETTHIRWSDGLVVEIKTEQLGRHAPWKSCRTCAVRHRCREGIAALRLNHRGQLRLCMDRPDLSLDLSDLARREGHHALSTSWRGFIEKEAA